ncbi:MAG: IPT/TIG domain-containing protein [Bacteroidetes bacterium]|nr:IPT/TIG domain-containing protein [Bacteroidota bacterium]
MLINSSCKKDEDDTDCPNCPKISKILPEEGYHQDWISIQGSNLQKTDEGPITVSFNGVVVDSDSIEVVSDTEVRARVPKACGTGVVKVFYDSELFSSENIILNT